jgi:hypothetical protein
MSQVVTTFGHQDGPALIHGDGAPFAAMNSSLGHMTAAYIGDVQTAVTGGGAVPQPNVPPGARLNGPDTVKLVATLGRDPDAYATVLHAQQAYTAAQIHDVLIHNSDHGDLLAEAVRNAAQPGAVVPGVLAGGRVDEVYRTHQVSDAAYNAKITDRAGWATKIWDLTGGKEAGKIVVPGVGGYVNDQVHGMIQNIADKYMIHTGGSASDDAAQALLAAGSGTSAQAAVAAAAVGTPLSKATIDELAASAANSAQAGFSYGNGTLFTGVNGGPGHAGKA